jgi:hypothetical protein
MTAPAGAGDGRRPPRRAPRLGEGQAPFTTVVVLLVAAGAVIAGLVIFRSIDETVGSADASTATTVAAPSTISAPASTAAPSTTTTSTTTTAPAVAKSDATVVVANASGVGGSASAMDADLVADGYTTAPVANATGPRLQRSIIYFVGSDPAAFAVARLLADQIPTAQTLPMPDPPPLDRPLAGATVALLLGADAAGRELADLQTG